MTTKKTTTAKSSTAAKATAKKPAAAKKATTTKKTASKATAIAEPALVAPTVKEKLTTTVMMPEAPVTEIAMEAVVAKAEPQAPVAETPAATQTIVLTIGMLQKRLSELGAYDGAWDGVYGPMTKHAVARFQAKTGLAVNGDSNAATLAALGLDLYKTY